MPVNTHVAAHRLAIEVVLEGQKAGSVGDACDDLEHVVGCFRVRRDHAEQLFGVIQWLLPGQFSRGRQLLIPRQTGKYIAGQAHAIGIVFSQILCGASDFSVHLRATEFLVGGDFAGRCLEQRRASEEHPRLAAHHHHVIR